MKFFKKISGGKNKNLNKTISENILDEVKNLSTNLYDKNFNLLKEISQLKDKIFKLENENNQNIKLIELKDKNIKNLEKTNKSLKSELNTAYTKIDLLISKSDLIISKQDEVLEVVDKLNGNIYEIKPIKKCTGSKQKMQVKSSSKNSEIIKKVVS